MKLLVHLAEFTNLTKAHVPILLAAYQGTLKDHGTCVLAAVFHGLIESPASLVLV